MIGVVLCGGNSTRMGSDKGLLKEEEETWAELAGRKLKALQLPVLALGGEASFGNPYAFFTNVSSDLTADVIPKVSEIPVLVK